MAIDGRWPAHGDFDMCWHGNVLRVVFRGVWNREAVALLLASVDQLLSEPGAPRRWAALADMREWEGATPEALADYEASSAGLIERGLTASARVFSVEFLNQMIGGMVHEHDRIPVLVTENMDEALAWLGSQGFALNKEFK